jgi:hypothetical protein
VAKTQHVTLKISTLQKGAASIPITNATVMTYAGNPVTAGI